MYDVNNNLAPKNITDLFTQIDTVHFHGTRASITGNYLVKYSRTTLQKNAFSRVGAKIWNSLPKYLRNRKKKEFTKELHTLLLNILDNEDDYVDCAENVCLILCFFFLLCMFLFSPFVINIYVYK